MAKIALVNHLPSAPRDLIAQLQELLEYQAAQSPVQGTFTLVIGHDGNVVFPITPRFARRAATDPELGRLVAGLVELASDHSLSRWRRGAP